MARFKKKKSAPTPDPTDSKKEPEKDLANIEHENIGPDKAVAPDMPPPAPAFSYEKNENDRKLNRLFWLRVGLAVIAGTAATFIFDDIEGEERRWASIAFMIMIFLVTIFIAKSMNMQLPSSDRKKIVTQGIGSYVFLYLFMWIVSYTLVNISDVSNGITSPI